MTRRGNVILMARVAHWSSTLATGRKRFSKAWQTRWARWDMFMEPNLPPSPLRNIQKLWEKSCPTGWRRSISFQGVQKLLRQPSNWLGNIIWNPAKPSDGEWLPDGKVTMEIPSEPSL